MSNRRTLLKSATALVAATVLMPATVQAQDQLEVVATFSILGDMVAEIGGDNIALTTLVGPDGDAHVYQPTPQSAAAVSDADVMFVNGLEFEGWLERLAEAAAFDGTLIVATNGIEPIAFEDDHDDHDEHDDHADHDDHDDHDHDDHDDHGHAEEAKDEDYDHDHDHDHAEEDHGHDDDHDHGDENHADHDDHDHGDEEHAEHDDHDHADHAGHDHGEFDPHAWQSIDNALIYVDNITNALAAADPENATEYFTNRAAYVAELEALQSEIETMMASIPEDRRTIVTSHDAFAYFGRDYGLTFLAAQGVSTEAEASAQDIAGLISQIRDDGISAVFVENIADPRLIEQIALETGAVVGGTLYPGALSGPDGPASTYLDMMMHNASTLAQALVGDT
ncbi:MAG: zinc ABC transporter substrate-binding protein [Pseudomonadota bacterium]